MSSTQSAELLLHHMMTQYCNLWSPSVYPDMKKLREVLTQLSDEQKLHILQQDYSYDSPLDYAALRDHTEIISTLLTSLQSSAYRLKLLMVRELTPLHAAAFCGHTESVKMILDCLTADQQIQIMSVQSISGMTAIQCAERSRHTDTVRVLREYQHSADGMMRAQQQRRRQEQQRIKDEKTRQRLPSAINAQFIIIHVLAVVIHLL